MFDFVFDQSFAFFLNISCPNNRFKLEICDLDFNKSRSEH